MHKNKRQLRSIHYYISTATEVVHSIEHSD